MKEIMGGKGRRDTEANKHRNERTEREENSRGKAQTGSPEEKQERKSQT